MKTSSRLRTFARLLAARLRFLGVFAAALLIVGTWGSLRAGWDRLFARPAAEGAISSNSEYFCPMDPGMVSDWASKCPICHMTLVRRKRGEAAALPDGVVARMQFTPDRLWLGGIQTGLVDYAPLCRTIEAPGVVEGDPMRVRAEFFDDQAYWLAVANETEIGSLREAHAGVTVKGTIESAGSFGTVVRLECSTFRPGEPVRVSLKCPIERIAPFRDMPSEPPPLGADEPRKLYACMDHRDVVRDGPGRCPRDQAALMPMTLRDNQRLRWWCPMHPEVTADRPGASCAPCGGMALVPRVVSYRPPGSVLGVPASAVIHQAGRDIVFVEHGAGMFDATVVRLGPRCDDRYPVIAGLDPGDRVAARGAFLIDAETRLDANAAASYFGAGPRAESGPSHESGTKVGPLAGLPEADRALAEHQKTCPVTGKALGSMGVPPRVEVRGRTVFLCCSGCRGTVEMDPDKYLAKLP
jgi:hypothetical protein